MIQLSAIRLLPVLVCCGTALLLAQEKTPAAKKPATKQKSPVAFAPAPALSVEQRMEVEQLIKQLSHEEYRLREAASNRILQIGPGALVQLQAAAAGDDAELRSRLAELIRLLQTRALREVAVLTDHEDWVWSLEFSHNGQWLASAGGGKLGEEGTGKDTALRIWNVASQKKVKECVAHNDTIFHVSWSHDDSYLLTASADGSARMWQTATGEEYRAFRGHSGAVLRAFFAQENEKIVTIALPNTLRVFQVDSGKLLHELEWPHGTITAAHVSPKNNMVAVASGKKVHCFNLATQQIVPGEINHDKNIHNVYFAKNGEELHTCSNDAQIQVWNVVTGKKVRSIAPGNGNVEGYLEAASVPFAACFTQSRAIVVLDTQSRPTRTFLGHSGAILSVAFSPDGNVLASAGKDGSIRLWSLTGLVEK